MLLLHAGRACDGEGQSQDRRLLSWGRCCPWGCRTLFTCVSSWFLTRSQISLGDARSYFITTARNDLGVVFATSDAGQSTPHPRRSMANYSQVLPCSPSHGKKCAAQRREKSKSASAQSRKACHDQQEVYTRFTCEFEPHHHPHAATASVARYLPKTINVDSHARACASIPCTTVMPISSSVRTPS